jgi:voltage-gated potassium channel
MQTLFIWAGRLAHQFHILFRSQINLLMASLLLVFVIAGGTFGYMVIEDYSFFDAIYMTVITIATVGYGEVVPLSAEGRMFTILLIMVGLGVFAYAITVLSSQIVEGRLKSILNIKLNRTNGKKMENHVIVVGYGRNGRQAVKDLKAYNYHFVVVDSNKEATNGTSEDIPFIVGDATDDDVLSSAGIHKAKALLSCLPVDADNLFVVLTARSLNPSLTIISRAANASSEKKLRVAGVNSVVLPEQIGGAHMVKLVARHNIVEFLEHLSIHGESPTTLEEVDCRNLPSNMNNKSINELEIRSRCGVNVIGLKTTDGEYLINPPPDTTINRGAKLFILGTRLQIEKTRRLVAEIQ